MHIQELILGVVKGIVHAGEEIARWRSINLCDIAGS